MMSKLNSSTQVLALGRKLTDKSLKPLGFSTIAMTLAACDLGDFFGSDSSETPPATTPVTVVDPPVAMSVNGTDLDGEFFDGSDIDTVELTGNIDPNVDAGEWINVAQVVVRDANGDFTLTDLQSTDNDAASGTAGTTYALSDTGQNTTGTTTFNFDLQAVDGLDTSVTLSVNEAAGRVVLSGGDIETLNLVIDDISAADVTALTSLDVEGIETLVISGGQFGYLFTIVEPLNETISTLDASQALSFLNINITQALSSTYLLGQGDDMLIMGNTLGSNDFIEGGAGSDTISTVFEDGTTRTPEMAGVETINAVFTASATVDGSKITGLTSINLGLDGAGDEAASTANVDFNDISAELANLNIHASQRDVEVDYVGGAQANLAVNFTNDDGAISIGNGVGSDIELHHVQSLAINQSSQNAVVVQESIDLNGDTEFLTITTSTELGTLEIAAADTAFDNTNTVQAITVSAADGDMTLGSSGAAFVGEATALLTYDVASDDAELSIAAIGSDQAAISLLQVSFDLTNDSSLSHGAIIAHSGGAASAEIAVMNVTTSSLNVLAGVNASGNVNFYLEGLYADSIAEQNIDVSDGGHVELDHQLYTVEEQTFIGSGDITIAGADTLIASNAGYVQLQAADASNHSGDRYFVASATGDDVFYGSDQADNVLLAFDGDKTYHDAGGNDTVVASGTGTRIINDGTAGSDDSYTFAAGAGGFVFNAGSGNDSVDLISGSNLADFGSWSSGVVELTSFLSGSDMLSFDGLGSFTSTLVNPMIAPGASIADIDSNTSYLLADGDVAVGGEFVANYLDLTDVADFLDNVTQGSGDTNDVAIFVVNNAIVTPNTIGDDHNAYVYIYQETGAATGIQAQDLTLLASIDTVGGPVAVSDIV